MRWQLAACLVLVLCVGANAQVFEHRGWKGYEVEGDPNYGCRMAKHVQGDVHVIAYGNQNEGFGIGLVKGSWSLSVGKPVTGWVTFDRIHRHMLEGRVENPQLVMLNSHAEEGGLAGPFAGSRTIEVAAEGIQAATDLGGSSRALTMLYECAERYMSSGYQSPSANSRGAISQNAADVSFMRQGADFLPLRERLLDAGWQAIFSRATNSSDANAQRTYGLPELETCSGTGMGFCALSYGDARGNILSVTTAGGTDFILHSWSLDRE